MKHYLYIMTNKNNSVLYTGITNDINRRYNEHKEKLLEGFTKRYKVNKLVYFEEHNNLESARKRESQIKGGSRAKKIVLIESQNPNWDDLCDDLM